LRWFSAETNEIKAIDFYSKITSKLCLSFWVLFLDFDLLLKAKLWVFSDATQIFTAMCWLASEATAAKVCHRIDYFRCK
jgi:hypothetical protein